MILIAAGSNLPFCGSDSQQIVFSAFLSIRRFVTIQEISPLYQSPAWPDPADPPFVNAVASVRTDLPPLSLLAALRAVETALGRQRNARNAPRTLDLDLIGYDAVVMETPTLTLPHPRMADRDFVLGPLCDIASDWRHPMTGRTAAEMFAAIKAPTAKPLSADNPFD